MTSSTLQNFMAMLEAADAVTVDDGALLSHWQAAELNGTPDNQVVHFTWTDAEGEYSDTLTEGGIAAGRWAEPGKFVAENLEGELTVVRFFTVRRLLDVPAAETAPAGSPAGEAA